MSTNTYTDPVFTTELREWIQNDTEEYEDVGVDVYIPAWNKGLKKVQDYSFRIGVPRSEETKKKISTARKAQKDMMLKLSDEHKLKISEGLKKYYRENK